MGHEVEVAGQICRINTGDNVFAAAGDLTPAGADRSEVLRIASDLKDARREAEIESSAKRLKAAKDGEGSGELLRTESRSKAAITGLAVLAVRLAGELALLRKKPVPDVEVQPIKGSFRWQVSLVGKRLAELRFPMQYPHAPPTVLLD